MDTLHTTHYIASAMFECTDVHQLMLGPLVPDGILFGEASEHLGDGAMVADMEH